MTMTDDLQYLATRLDRLEARAELWELVARYGVAVDDEDYDTLRLLFASDAEFAGLDGPPNVGRDNVVAYLKRRNDTAHALRLHTPTAQFLDELDDDRAAGTVSCYAGLYAPDGELTFFAFRYDDRYVREDGRWKFARRHVHHLTHLVPRQKVG